MNRREFLKKITLAAGFSSLFFTFQKSYGRSYILITDRVDDDISTLLSLDPSLRRSNLEIVKINPLSQDLTVLNRGIINPHFEGNVSRQLKRFADNVRSRKRDGTYLVTAGSNKTQNSGATPEVVVEMNGQVVERIPVEKDYRSIILPGKIGSTEIRLNSGAVEVVRASCSHQLCKKMGTVRQGRIICAPNRLVIYLPENISLDAITS